MVSCAAEKDYLVTTIPNWGKMYAVLYDETPGHKEFLIDLAISGRYDSTEFQQDH